MMPVTLYTSSYKLAAFHPKAVGITRGYPRFLRGVKVPLFQKLAPTWAMLKNPHYSDELFRAQMINLLDELDANDVINELGDGTVMLCYEDVHAGEFCHRRIVAEWMENEAGITVPELSKNWKDALEAPQSRKSTTR